MKQFQLYVRSGCHLCDEMEHELSVYLASSQANCQASSQIRATRIYIDNDETLIKLYGERIPVLMFGETLVCEYFLDTDRLKQILEAEKK